MSKFKFLTLKNCGGGVANPTSDTVLTTLNKKGGRA